MEKRKQHILSPKILTKGEDQSYIAVEELVDVLMHKECQNIALTGPYGSGKSSILRTLCKEYSKKENDNLNSEQQHYNFLNISLAAFHCENGSDPDDRKPTTNFEYSLLQQLFYAATPDELSQSRFKRIRHLSGVDIQCMSTRVILFIVAFVVLFEPSGLRVESFYAVYNKLGVWWGNFLNVIGDIVAAGYMLYIMYLFISTIIKHLYNARLTKLGTKEGVVEIPNTASAFNQHLDEIIYFFEATNYDVVIFEDIDRFKNPEVIFNKLREVNLLINNSHFCGEKRTIKFLYAIRDDIFIGELRTKFFDYIVSVAPIVNLGNAKNYLKDHLKEAGITDVEEQDLMNIGAFIGSMRELKNVVNEFRQHKEMFDPILKPKNLLAMIVYKNIYPRDYAELHNNNGVLYRALQLKSMFANRIVEQNDTKIQDLKSKITDLGNKYEENHIIDNNDPASLSDIYRQIKEYQRISIELPHTSLSATLKLYNNAFDIIEIVKDECLSEYNKQQPCKIVNKSSVDETYEKLCRFVVFLLRNGYVDYSYENYITYYSPGSLTKSDNEFYLDVLSGKNHTPNYPLVKVQELIKLIDIEHFSNNYVLNYDLLDGLLHNNNYQKRIKVLDNIIANKDSEFLLGYYKDRGMSNFISCLIKRWSGFINDINNISNTETKYALFEIYYKFICQDDCYLSVDNVKILADNFGALVYCYQHLDKDKLEELLVELELKYAMLKSREDCSDDLYDMIVDNSHFEINRHNIDVVVGGDFGMCSYTSLLEHKNENVKKYVLNNIDLLHPLIPSSSNSECSDAIVYVANSKLSNDDKLAYLKQQNNGIESLSDIDNNNKLLLFLSDKIKPTWANVNDLRKNVQQGTSSREMIDFIDRFASELSSDIDLLLDEDRVWFSQVLFYENELSIESFKCLLLAMNHKFIDGDISNIDKERLSFVLENNIIAYNRDYTNIILNTLPEQLNMYLLNNFDDYLADSDDGIILENDENIEILNSELTLVQKINWLLTKEIDFGSSDSSKELARLICFYYDLACGDPDAIELFNWDLILSALELCESWSLKITLINKINAKVAYERVFVSKLINTLGDEYIKLNKLKKHPSFDDNTENRVLIDFLYVNKHISTRDSKDGKIKVNCRYK